MVYFNIHAMMSTIFPSWSGVMRTPKAFFSGLPSTPRFFGSVLMITAVAMLAGFVVYPFDGALMMFAFPVTWIILVMGMLSWAHFLSWGIAKFSDSRLVPSNAFLLSAYASVPLVVMFIPWLGIVAVVWSIYLMWVGIVERGRVSPLLAAGLMAVPGILLLAFAVLSIDMLPQLKHLL